MSKIKRNSVRLRENYGPIHTNVVLISDMLAKYIKLLRRDGVNDYNSRLSSVLWSGTINGYNYSEAPCELSAGAATNGYIFISAFIYNGYFTEDNHLGRLLRIFDAPLSYYEDQLDVIKPSDTGMSILINVKEQ